MRKNLRSSVLGLLLLELLAACGSRTVRGRTSPSEFCDVLLERLAECNLDASSKAQCQDAIATRDDQSLDRARACLEAPCRDLAQCVNGELGTIVPVGPGAGGTTGAGGSGMVDEPCPGPVTCLDAATATHCNEQGQREVIDCATAMADQGIESNGCRSDADGAGCTIDAFLDPECEAGTPPFVVCAGLGEQDLVNAYVACFQHLNEAAPMISCYRDYVDEAEKLVDCGSARTACAL